MTVPPEDEPQAAPTPRMLTWAKNATIYRLERWMMSERQLHDAIARKAKSKFEDINEAQVAALARYAVSFAHELKAIDDRTYAETMARSGERSGRSKRFMAQKLAIKGVGQEDISAALAQADDRAAAVAFAKRRAFGPFRRLDADEKRLAKEFAAFMRNGFSSSLTRQVMDMEPEEALEILDEARGR